MTPYHEDDTVTLWHGDALDVLRQLDDGSVDCCVTSPPYFGLRDYGQDGQYGLEASPAEYVETMRALFAEVRRVLADDGTLWLNLGDSYSGSGKGAASTEEGRASILANGKAVYVPTRSEIPLAGKTFAGLPAKNLMGIPWRVAFALQDDGWILRNDIIWAKPNAMPEPVGDRLATRHEHVFLFSKSPRYYFDLDPIREQYAGDRAATRRARKPTDDWKPNSGPAAWAIDRENAGGRNPGDVWTIPTQPFSEAHFAVMPLALAERCVQAGCRPAGKRCDCDDIVLTPAGTGDTAADPSPRVGRAGMARPRRDTEGTRPITRREQRGHAAQLRTHPHRATIEARAGSAFAHYIRTDLSGARPLPPELLTWLNEKRWLEPVPPCEHPPARAGTVLDPFSGSGTTGLAAARNGRPYVGIDLSADYLDLSLRTRLAQQTLDFGAPA